MKKFTKVLVAFVLTFVCLVSLASCSKVNQKYADKVNAAAEAKENYTVEQIRKDLGDEAVEVLVLNSGVIYAVKGCKSLEEVEKKIDEEKDVEGLVITIVAGKATAAAYKKISTVKDEKK